MEGTLSLLQSDIAGLVGSFAITDVARWGFYAVFAALLFFPLKGVDRRDTWSAVTYMATMCAFAVALLIAIPVLPEGNDTMIRSSLVVCGASGLAAARWFVGVDKSQTVVVKVVIKEGDHGAARDSKEDGRQAA